MHQPSDLEACFKQGMWARAHGKARADNPFDLGTPEHGEWDAGWSATFDLDEDDDPQSMRVKPGPTDTGSAWDTEDDPGSDPISARRRRR